MTLKTVSPPAVDRALAILEELARSKRGLRLSEITGKLGLPKSSTHCLLVALERRGYLWRNEKTGRYLFGAKIFTLANLALSEMRLREVAHPVLTRLMRRTALLVNMAIVDRDQAVLIEQIAPPQLAPPITWLGKRLDLHCTALGKVLAASQPEEEWNRLVKEHTLTRYNDNTISSPKKFLGELDLTRERGYAIDDEETDLGVRCLAVPVVTAPSEAVAAISVAGTISEIHSGNAEELVELLKASSTSIEEAMRAEPASTR